MEYDVGKAFELLNEKHDTEIAMLFKIKRMMEIMSPETSKKVDDEMKKEVKE